MILTTARTPDAYAAAVDGWRGRGVQALRDAVREAAPDLAEALKWGHLVYQLDGPVLLVRAEPQRLLLGFWRGQRLRHLEPRLKPGGQYEMATLDLREHTPLERTTVMRLVGAARDLARALGDPTRKLTPRRP